MVRVGGGWVSLDEFLIKNDPCRGKLQNQIDYFARQNRRVASLQYLQPNLNPI